MQNSDFKSRAEKIIEHDPNGLVVVDNHLNIIQFNKSLLKIFGIIIHERIIGRNVNEILGQNIFPNEDITTEMGSVKHHKKSGHIVKLITFKLHDEENLQACFFVDITSNFHSRQKLIELRNETIAKARAVINRQMSVAQEIASLMGETTAESKASLIKLINVLEEESEIYE